MTTNQLYNNRLEKFKSECKQKNLRLTPQKLEIFSLLVKCTSHPTAEEIYQKIQKKFPTMSLATVYRNLKQLVKIGLAVEIDIGDGASHFDPNIDDHDHLVFTDTKEIRDICLSKKNIFLPDVGTDLEVEKINVNIFVKKKY